MHFFSFFVPSIITLVTRIDKGREREREREREGRVGCKYFSFDIAFRTPYGAAVSYEFLPSWYRIDTGDHRPHERERVQIVVFDRTTRFIHPSFLSLWM